MTYSVYFAGELFDHKHLVGNLLLAQAIERAAENRYRCLLPQVWEANMDTRDVAVRNKDISMLMRSDVALFNFDGTDIDSGTVVEFMLAKMLDIPSVLLRTDCRQGGDMNGGNWNLMLEGYPRTYVVKVNAIHEYNKRGIEALHMYLGELIAKAFDVVRAAQPVVKSPDEIRALYEHCIRMCGSQMEQSITPAEIAEIIDRKRALAIY